MKKLLLLFVAACFIFGANAQKDAQSYVEAKLKVQDSELQLANPLVRTMPPITSNDLKATSDIVKVPVGVAHSQRSLRREGYRVVSYNKDLDLITVSMILKDTEYPGVALSDGTVAIFYSEDHGLTWNGPVVLSDFLGDEKRNYYQEAIIYNPAGNTDVANAYGIYQGVAPDNPGGTLGDWDNSAFGASTFGGANYSTVYYEGIDAYDGYWNTFGLTQVGDMLKCMNLITLGDWSNFSSAAIEDIQGTYNGTGIDWELDHGVMEVPFYVDADVIRWEGMYVNSDEAAGIAWSDDGQIGYAWMVGLHENEETGYWPIMFKSTDGGSNWDEIELDFLDEDVQEGFSHGAEDPLEWELFPCQSTVPEYMDFAIPWIVATDGVVDAEGYLHLVAHCKVSSRDFLSGDNYEWSIENVRWSYNYAGSIYKFKIGDELIDAISVDTLMSDAAESQAGSDSLYCGTDGWLHRLHISKDERSEELFVTWNDTPEARRYVADPNYMPDLKGWSYNTVTGEHTDAVCFTCEATLPFEHYWYTSAAERAYYDASDSTFTVPYVSGVSLDDFYANTSSSDDPVHFEYIRGVTFPALVPIPVGVDEFTDVSTISVSQNLPNPATGITTIEVSSETIAPVTVEITNITGQTVYRTDAGIVNGSMSVKIDVSDFDAGVYFYTVTVANELDRKSVV